MTIGNRNVASAIGSIAVDVQHRAGGRRLVIDASHCTADELGATVADLVRHDHECRGDHTVILDNGACVASPAKASDDVRSVRIESLWGSRGRWRVELNFVEYPQQLCGTQPNIQEGDVAALESTVLEARAQLCRLSAARTADPLLRAVLVAEADLLVLRSMRNADLPGALPSTAQGASDADLQIMALVLRRWYNQEPDRRLSAAARETAAFLWLLVLLAVLVLGGLYVASELHGLKEHRHHRTHAAGLVERAHGLELQAARQEGNDAHAADGAGHARGGA
jgi:hypothetical protein